MKNIGRNHLRGSCSRQSRRESGTNTVTINSHSPERGSIWIPASATKAPDFIQVKSIDSKVVPFGNERNSIKAFKATRKESPVEPTAHAPITGLENICQNAIGDSANERQYGNPPDMFKTPHQALSRSTVIRSIYIYPPARVICAVTISSTGSGRYRPYPDF